MSKPDETKPDVSAPEGSTPDVPTPNASKADGSTNHASKPNADVSTSDGPTVGVTPDASRSASDSRVATAAELARFLGVWELDASRCVYEVGGAPQKATYVLESVEHEGATALRIAMAWVSAEGESLSLTLVAPVDGIARPLVAPTRPSDTTEERPSSVRPPAPVDTLGFDLIDERTLDSMAYRGQEPRAHVRRVVSEDGRELHIVQTFTMDDRLQLVNESWYVRG